MHQSEAPVTQDEIRQIGLQIGTLTRAISIVVASMHGAGVLDGRSVARSIRIDHAGHEELRLALADLIDRSIEVGEVRGGARPRPVE
jgi:hypothetical protein